MSEQDIERALETWDQTRKTVCDLEGYWKHYDGQVVRVIGPCLCADGPAMVVEAVGGPLAGLVEVITLAEWVEPVVVGEGSVQRFKRIKEGL